MTSPASTPPSRDELLAMAYFDGELDEAARTDFERRLQTSPELGRELAELGRLAVLARQAAPPEPMDYEWEAIARSPLQRTLHPTAWFALALGTIALAVWTAWSLFNDDSVHLAAKTCIALSLTGLGVLFFLVLRNRLRTLPFDPYRDVHR